MNQNSYHDTWQGLDLLKGKAPYIESCYWKKHTFSTK